MANINFDNSAITFGDAGLAGESSNNPTALMFSRSGEPVLFVAQLDGTIKRYVVEKQNDGSFAVSNANSPNQTGNATINITTVKDTVENYDALGNVATGSQTDQRQITGLVTATETIDDVEYDVLYVSTSDRRHGGGGGATDKGVDPNSGQVNKLIVDKFSGEVVDSYAVIRGLPRSSENHSTNGIDLAVDANGDTIMYIAQGGNTNKGAPSNNFVGFIDGALSGTILKVNLTELESYDVRTGANGEKFILDLPTLNDPGREDVDLSAMNIQNLAADPLFAIDEAPGNAPEWAGSSDAGNGTNSAKITSHVLVSEGGQLKLVDNPMSVFQPGYRNQYDVHVTENGEIVSWDNGPNGGWGGQPIPLVDQVGGANYVEDWTQELATNDFNEPGSSTFGDYLHVAGKVDDDFGPYAGDANPLRAAVEAVALAFHQDQPLYVEANGALEINPAVYKGATPETPIFDYDGTTVLFTGQDQALDFLSRLTPHYDEQSDGSWADVREDGPGGYKLMPIDLHTVVAGYDWKSPGSSIADPAKHFDGTDIAADTAFSPESELLAPGEDGGLLQGGTSTNGLSEYVASSWFGGALKGTIISTAFGGSKLQFVELQDTNGDDRTDDAQQIGTIDAFGSNPLSVQALGDDGLSAALIDNDNDGVDDFSGTIWAATYGADNITTFVPGGTPTDPSVDADGDGIDDTQDTHAWAADNGEGVVVGAPFQPLSQRWEMELSSDGRPDGAATTVGPAPDAGIVAAWKNGQDPARNGGLYDEGNFDLGGASSFASVNLAPVGSAEGGANAQKDALGVGAILSSTLASATITAEMLNIFDYQLNTENGAQLDGGEKVGIYVGPDQSTFMHAAVVVQDDGTAVLELYTEEDDAGAQSETVALTGIEAPLQVVNQDSVVQIAFALDLDAATVTARARYQNPNLDGSPSTADADWSTWFETAPLAIPADVLASLYGDYVNFGSDTGATVGMFANAPDATGTFAASWDWIEIEGVQRELTEGEVLYRWNAGGGDVAAVDGGPNWTAAPDGLVQVGSSKTSTHNFGDANNFDVSIPTDTTPAAIFDKEQWGNSASNPMGLEFAVPAIGEYAVRLFMGNGFGGTSGSGQRVFDVSVENELFLDDVDLSATLGHQTGGMFEWIGTVSDGTIDIDFTHVVENPLVNAVEILALGDGEPAGPVVSILGASVVEGAGSTGVTVQTDVPVPADATVVVNWEVRAVTGGATPETEFAAPTGSFVDGDGVYQGQGSIAGGSADLTIPLDILDDLDPEGDETFEVVITGVSGANATIGTASATVTIEDDDAMIPDGPILYRVNAGGAELAATDGGPAWTEDQSADTGGLSVANGSASAGTPSPYLDTSVTDQTFGASFSGTNATIVPDAAFATERYGQIYAAAQGDSTLSYDFAVADGDYVVNLYFAEVWSGANTPGKRVFDVEIEGQLAFDDVDLTADYGFNTVGLASFATSVSDGSLDLDFLKGSANNPKVSAIEIVAAGDAGTADVTLSIAAAADAEESGDTGQTVLAFPLTASGSFTGQIEVAYEVAVGGGDPAAATATVDFTDGAGTLEVGVDNDDADDGDETVAVTLTGGAVQAVDPAAVTLGTPTASAAVTEDDEPVGPPATGVLFRVNVGGPEIAATDGGPAWGQDQGQFGAANNSPYLVANTDGGSTYDAGSGGAHPGDVDVSDASIPAGTPAAIFETERYDLASAPEQQWKFPVADMGLASGDTVEVRLYFAELFGTVDQVGERVFDVAVEGAVPAAFDDIDQIAVAGPKGAFMRSATVTIDADDTLDLTLIHGIENPALKGIEVLASEGDTAPADVTLSISGTPEAVENGDVDPTTLSFDLTASDGFAGQIEVAYTLDIDGTATTETALVDFASGAGQLDVAVPSDDADDGPDAVSVTLTGATDQAAEPATVLLGTATATGSVTEDDASGVDPDDIDGDGIVNTDDPFAYDGTNGLGDVLVAGGAFRQDFDTDGGVFAEGGFTGIIVNQAFNPAGTSESDPYGDRTTEATSLVQGGVLKIESSETDLFNTGTGNNNTIKDNYVRGADVSGVDGFSVETKIQGGWLGTVPGQFASFGLTLGAGGTDDYVKFVIGGSGNDPRFQLAQENSLDGTDEENESLSGNGIDPSDVASVVLRLDVDKAASPATLTATAVFYDANDAELGTITSTERTIAGSLAAALDGQNPLTGETGGIAYGVSITDWGNQASNRFTGEWEYLELRGPEVANAAPTVTLAQTLFEIAEDADTTATTKVADIVVDDDGIGTNALDIAGADAGSFVIVDGADGPELRLAAGVALDFGTKDQFDVTVTVDDADVGGTPDDTASLTLSVADVLELPDDVAPEVAPGDFSDDHTAPTVSTLAEGENVVVAAQEGFGNDVDFLTVVVPEGHVLSGIDLTGFDDFDIDADNAVFVGLAEGDSFPFAFGTAEVDAGALLGGAVVFESDVADDADLLARFADGEVQNQGPGILTQGFDAPLPAGTYTFGFSQNQGPTATSLSLTVEQADPFPGVYRANANGNFVFEMEEAIAQDLPGGWIFKTNEDLPDGHQQAQGGGYVEATDGQHLGSPNNAEQDTLTFDFLPEQDGFVRLNLVASFGTPPGGTPSSTDHNDTWAGVLKDGQPVEAITTNANNPPEPKGTLGLHKLYSSGGSIDDFQPANRNVDNVGVPVVVPVTAGEVHTFMVQVRSTYHQVDRAFLEFSPTAFGNTIDENITRMKNEPASERTPDIGDPGGPGDPVGAAVLSINENQNGIEASNFGNNSFKITNTGTKKIAAIELDVTEALFPDAVFDPFGEAGDSIGQILAINTEGETGVITPTGGFGTGAVGVTYFGEGGAKGFEKIRLEFADFDPGETLGFRIDMDPNSIAGMAKTPLDNGAIIVDKQGDDTWDVGGIGGAELIHSLFHVTYDDDTTSEGRLQGQGTNQQIGAKALSTQAANDKVVTLTVNGLGAGQTGTYADGGPTVTVQGEDGDVARIALAKGFIVPFENTFSGADATRLDDQLAALAASAFPANNAAEFQYHDIALDGTVQDVTSLFDFTGVDAFTIPAAFYDEAKLPLGFAASVIDETNDLPLGPVTAPIHLVHADTALPTVFLTAPASVPEAGDTSVTTVAFTAAVSDPDFAGSLDVTYDETVDGTTVRKIATLDFSGADAPVILVEVANDDEATADRAVSVQLVSTTAENAAVSTAVVESAVADDDGGLVEGAVLLRINAFGPELTATDGGPNWVVDTPFYSAFDDRGDTLLTATAGDTGAPDELFQETRSADSAMNFAIDAAEHLNGNGTYKVKLYFTEPFFGSADSRVFDTEIEDVVPDNLDNLDPAAVTSKGVGFVVENVVEVSDGVLNIEPLTGALSEDGGVQNPVISGIEIVEIVPGGATWTLDGAASVQEAGDAGGFDYALTITTNDEGAGDYAVEVLSDGTVLSSVQVSLVAGANAVTLSLPNDDADDGTDALTVRLVDPADGAPLGQPLAVAVTEDDVDPTQVAGASAAFAVTPNGGLGASTFFNGSFTLANTGAAGTFIETVVFDLSSAILPDMVFDPIGSGGDAATKVLTMNSGAAATGFVAPTSDTSAFSAPRNGGWDEMTLEFTDFGAGESVAFAVDVDPNSIQNGAGSGEAGAVSGAELAGARVSVTFSDGTATETTVGALFGDGPLGGATGSVDSEAAAPAAPTVTVAGRTDEVASLPGDQITVPETTATVTVSGAVGASVILVQRDARLLENSAVSAFDVTDEERPFYANELMEGAATYTGTIGADGTASFDVALLESAGDPAGGLNHFVAVLEDPATGDRSLASEPLVLKQGEVELGRTLTVWAGGWALDPADGEPIYPVIELFENGTLIGTAEVTNLQTAADPSDPTAYTGDFVAYAFEIAEGTSLDDYAIEFDNDAWRAPGGPGNDTNLFIDRVTLDGEEFQEDSWFFETFTNRAEWDGQREDLRPAGRLEFVLPPDPSETKTFTINAGGEAAPGQPLTFDVLENGVVLETVTVTNAPTDALFAGDYQPYEVQVSADAALTDLVIDFNSDFWVSPGGAGNDNNLYVDSVELDGVEFDETNWFYETVSNRTAWEGSRNDFKPAGRVEFLETPGESKTFTVNAGGEAIVGKPPTFSVYENGALIGKVTVDNAVEGDIFDRDTDPVDAFDFQVSADAALSDLTVVYDGDFYQPPGGEGNDTNLFVDSVVLDGTTFEEDSWTFRTFANRAELDGSVELLFAAGEIQFDQIA